MLWHGFRTMHERPREAVELARLEAVEGLLAHIGRYNPETELFEFAWPSMSMPHLRLVIASLVDDPMSQRLLHPDDRLPERDFDRRV